MGNPSRPGIRPGTQAISGLSQYVHVLRGIGKRGEPARSGGRSIGVWIGHTGMDGMADLRIDDVTTAGAVAGLRAAANRLTPVIRAVRALDTEVAGANALADELDQSDQSLAAALDNVGSAMAGLATWTDGAAAGFASTDRTLASEAPR
jgi:hypothetical protein